MRIKEVNGVRRIFGEDWSEKVVAELATELGIPTTTVELAHIEGKRGVLTPSFVWAQEDRLTHGNELLAGRDSSYPTSKTGQVPGYTLQAVHEVLAPYEAPPGLPDSINDAFAAFAGYLSLDALVANTDRHHENWAVIEYADAPARLAPSYDHGTSLGFQEPQERKNELLADPEGLSSWLHHGKSRHFEGRPRLLALAIEALGRIAAPAASEWRSRVDALDEAGVERILDRVPPVLMSQVDRKFAAAVIRENHERFLNAC